MPELEKQMNDSGTYELYKGYELAVRVEPGIVCIFPHRMNICVKKVGNIEQAKQWVDENGFLKTKH
jgi:hypothetical protein